MVSKTLYSSERHHWETPRELLDRVSRAVGGFTLDAAASETNHYKYNRLEFLEPLGKLVLL